MQKVKVFEFNEDGETTKRYKVAGFHFCSSERPQLVEITVDNFGKKHETLAIHIPYETLIRELARR